MKHGGMADFSYHLGTHFVSVSCSGYVLRILLSSMGFFVTLGVFFSFVLFCFSSFFPFILATCIIEGFYDRHVGGAKSVGAALIDDISRQDIHGFYDWEFGNLTHAEIHIRSKQESSHLVAQVIDHDEAPDGPEHSSLDTHSYFYFELISSRTSQSAI
jgi:hypothetical protein